jgi:hypothetical protein
MTILRKRKVCRRCPKYHINLVKCIEECVDDETGPHTIAAETFENYPVPPSCCYAGQHTEEVKEEHRKIAKKLLLLAKELGVEFSSSPEPPEPPKKLPEPTETTERVMFTI